MIFFSDFRWHDLGFLGKILIFLGILGKKSKKSKILATNEKNPRSWQEIQDYPRLSKILARKPRRQALGIGSIHVYRTHPIVQDEVTYLRIRPTIGWLAPWPTGLAFGRSSKWWSAPKMFRVPRKTIMWTNACGVQSMLCIYNLCSHYDISTSVPGLT